MSSGPEYEPKTTHINPTWSLRNTMPYDLQLACAEIDLSTHQIDELRIRYPELRFVFDKLEELQEECDEAEEKREEEVKDLETHADRVNDWVADAKTELSRAADEIGLTVDEDDPEQRATYTVKKLLVDLDATRDQINEVIQTLTWAGQ